LNFRSKVLKSQRSLSELHLTIIDDARLCNIPFCDADKQFISRETDRLGVSFLKVTLPTLGKALDAGLSSGQFICPVGTARSERELPLLGKDVFIRIFSDEGVLLKRADVECIRWLRQLLLLSSKMWEYPTPASSDLAWRSFVARQEDLLKVKFQYDHPVLELAAAHLGRVLKYLDLSTITPGHGPGAVAESLEKDERWEFSYWPSLAEKRYPFRMHGAFSLCPLICRRPPLLGGLTTRVVLVPKDFRGPRLISVEPVANQYLQQGQMRAIYSYIARNRFLSRSIRLEDQSFSQMRAKTSVNDGTFTLDLSDASDRLSVSLVWKLFSKLPNLRRQLFSTRTPFATYHGERVRLACFSPMGSAVCFPVETLCFYALAFASCRFVMPHMKSTLLADQITVFGDDIILPEICRDVIIGTLLAVGCSPNTSKTCYLTSFRESCGAEWYGSSDITIIRNRSVPYGHLTINDVPSLVTLQRSFFSRGMSRTASLLAKWCRDIFPVPFRHNLFDDEPWYLGGYGDNSPCAFRWNKDLHRLEAKVVREFSHTRNWLPSVQYGRLLARLIGADFDRVS
jgi:hypothetical protein